MAAQPTPGPAEIAMLPDPGYLAGPKAPTVTGATGHILGLALLTLGLGRCWALWAFGSPFYAPLQSEHQMAPLLASFGIRWEQWIDPDGYGAIPVHLATGCLGLYLLATATVAVWWCRPALRDGAAVRWGLGLFIGLGFILGLCSMTDTNNQVGMLIEHVGQILLPAVALAWGLGRQSWRLWARLAITATFVGHALYVLGWYPMPGAFPTMVMVCLGVAEPTAHQLLLLAGILDLVVAVGIWIPRAAWPCLLWAAIWGSLTALARPWHAFSPDFLGPWAHDWLHQAAVRVAHGALPLALWWGLRPRGGRSETVDLSQTADPAETA